MSFTGRDGSTPFSRMKEVPLGEVSALSRSAPPIAHSCSRRCDSQREQADCPEDLIRLTRESVLRNLAAHGDEKDISSQRAHEFIALAHGVMYAIASNAKRKPS